NEDANVLKSEQAIEPDQ
nr:LCP9=major cuticular protein {N-terminal} [Ceratitis capitata=Mediterranean fruit flies, cuticle, third instar larvae, Peptide Partial, 17 aa] [Ceratitis capitata]